MSYDDYAESPVHRFYQMWQQLDCSKSVGCLNDLFAWVEATVGVGTNGQPPPPDFTYREGAAAMGFYNVQQGDVPYFKKLADTYSMSDNFHQSVQGGTGANHIMLGTGDAIWFSDGNGNPLTPPHNMKIAAGSPNAGVVDEIENPDPLATTNNWYTQDGLWRRLLRLAFVRRRQLHRLRRHFTAGCQGARRLSEGERREAELPGGTLLPAEQL
jgi:phospholipase C